VDFRLDPEQQALRDAVREMAGRWDPSDEPGPPTHDPDRWRRLAEMGVLLDEGVGPVETMVVAEELGRARARTAYADTVLTGSVLAALDHDLLSSLRDGSAVVLPALAEPGRSWRSAPTVTADGDTLSGRKGPVPFGAAATHLVVRATDGLRLVEAPEVVDGVAELDGATGELLTPDDDVLTAALNLATTALLAEAFGAMQAAVGLTVDYLKTRQQFGVPLASFQALTHRAADLYVAQELARSVVQFAAMTMADDPTDSATVSRARVVVGRTARLVAQESIQLHGGIGMTAEYAVGHYAARLTDLEHTWGDTRQHLAALTQGLASYGTVDVL
jgi:alkylation response protein AidB-like acyl-CoA dehydrogenase